MKDHQSWKRFPIPRRQTRDSSRETKLSHKYPVLGIRLRVEITQTHLKFVLEVQNGRSTEISTKRCVRRWMARSQRRIAILKHPLIFSCFIVGKNTKVLVKNI